MPFLVRAPEPMIMPEKVFVVEVFVVRVKSVPRERLPEPAMAPIVILLPMARVPALTVVRPV